MDVKKETKLTEASFHMVMTVTPALAMQITLNVSNQSIKKIVYEQKRDISNASTRRKYITSTTPG